MAKDAYTHFVNALSDDLCQFAEPWLAGRSAREIARLRRCAVRTVERKVKIFLGEWQKMAETDFSR